ncbi:MAG: hypothetical protein ABWZ91_06290 [Nocardioides sp.]
MSLRHLAIGGFSGLLLTLVPVTVGATPLPGDQPPPGTGTRPCFLEPMHWNTALSGPVPRC